MTRRTAEGTVELLVLKRLSWGPMHGYGIASWIESVTDDVLRVEEGSLYPALYRMVRKGGSRARGAFRREVRLGRVVHTVVGVMPEEFAFPQSHDYWVPLRGDRRPTSGGRAL